MQERFAGGRGPVGVDVLVRALVCLWMAAPASAAAGGPKSPGVLSDCDGLISEITLHYDDSMTEELAPLYRDLFRALSNDVRIKVVCSSRDGAQQFRDRWGPLATRGGRDVSVINVGRPITVWARDRYIARQPLDFRGRAAALVPAAMADYEHYQLNEIEMHDLLRQRHLTPALMRLPLALEGGNVVANSRNVFVGMNVITENGGPDHETELKRELLAVLGRDFLLLGDEYGDVPWCHVDMYLTPIDDHSLLIASPELAAEFLRLACDEDDDPWKPDDPQVTSACPSDFYEMALDRIAEFAEQADYDVFRLPTLIDPEAGWMITYNNVLIEERGECKTVYLPVYDQPILDEAAVEIYRRLGFTVHTIDVSQVYTLGGALRCIVNVTERRSAAPRRPYALRRVRGRIRMIDLEPLPPRPAAPTLRSDAPTLRRARAA